MWLLVHAYWILQTEMWWLDSKQAIMYKGSDTKVCRLYAYSHLSLPAKCPQHPRPLPLWRDADIQQSGKTNKSSLSSKTQKLDCKNIQKLILLSESQGNHCILVLAVSLSEKRHTVIVKGHICKVWHKRQEKQQSQNNFNIILCVVYVFHEQGQKQQQKWNQKKKGGGVENKGISFYPRRVVQLWFHRH